jgi:hypothetical protein
MYQSSSEIYAGEPEKSVLYELPSGMNPNAYLVNFSFWHKLPPQVRKALIKKGVQTVIGFVEYKYDPKDKNTILLIKRLANFLPGVGRSSALKAIRLLKEAGFMGEMFAER